MQRTHLKRVGDYYVGVETPAFKYYGSGTTFCRIEYPCGMKVTLQGYSLTYVDLPGRPTQICVRDVVIDKGDTCLRIEFCSPEHYGASQRVSNVSIPSPVGGWDVGFRTEWVAAPLHVLSRKSYSVAKFVFDELFEQGYDFPSRI
tara:strand:- start:6340 stop:6774 length:435 start_codon:yes stop_codon:yes gene_type:complete